MSQCFSSRQATITGSDQILQQRITGLILINFLSQQARNVNINMLTHCAHCSWISTQLHHRQDRITNNIALIRWE